MNKNLNQYNKLAASIVLTLLLTLISQISFAHHVLGRPSYSLNEDSNTPPSMQIETQIGSYYVTFMAYPAFPKANEAGRVNFYASKIIGGDSFDGEVKFTVRKDTWFNSESTPLGTQAVDDHVYRQGFVFHEDGHYIVTAEFESEGEPYIIDFPLTIGTPSPLGPVGIVTILVFLVLLFVNLIQRKRLSRMQTARSRDDNKSDEQ